MLQLLPLAVGPGQVAINRAVLTFAGVDQHRDMAGKQTLFAVGDEYSQAGFQHLLLQAL
ncbi:hypothetical protein D3C81_1994150 [compost metagenome]